MGYRIRASVAAGVLAIGPLAGAGASVSAAYRASDNIRLVRHVEVPGGTGGGRLIGKYFYVSTATGLQIYDVSDPARPDRVGRLGPNPSIYSSFHYAAQEDPDTNGEVYLSDRNGGLQTIDVGEVRRPRVVGALRSYQHTWTCIA
ncbi:MAG: hypothetical protein ACRDJJ_09315, partial [Actinomycetota bacterium]